MESWILAYSKGCTQKSLLLKLWERFTSEGRMIECKLPVWFWLFSVLSWDQLIVQNLECGLVFLPQAWPFFCRFGSFPSYWTYRFTVWFFFYFKNCDRAKPYKHHWESDISKQNGLQVQQTVSEQMVADVLKVILKNTKLGTLIGWPAIGEIMWQLHKKKFEF